MRSGWLVVYSLVIFLYSTTAISQIINQSIDYQGLIGTNASTAEFPIGYSYSNHGPYTARDRVWVFYSNGQDALWKTKQFQEGGTWSAAQVMFPEINGSYFNIAFDGEYFHVIHEVNGEILYKRGKAELDGSITFTNEVVAYSNETWKATNRHFAITVDHEKKPWIITKVSDGPDTDSNYKTIALSSTADDGTWVSRAGFPADLSTAYNKSQNGRGCSVSELSPGKILFTWANYRTTITSPDREYKARLWDNGTLGPVESTELTFNSGGTAIVSPQDGIALLHSVTEVARRESNGTWVRVDPEDMEATGFWNTLSEKDGIVRFWDFNENELRYKETADNGQTWSAITTKWSSPQPIAQMSASHIGGSQGTHHSLLWVTGSSPYDIYMGIEGTIELPGPPALVSPIDGETDLPRDVTLEWESVDLAYTYDVQVSTDSEFSTAVIDESGITETSYEVTGLELNTTFFWRVRSVTEWGTASDWSQVWRFELIGLPLAPLLVSPEEGAENQSTSLTFSWEPSPGAETYQLQVATLSDFSATFSDIDNIQDTRFVVSGLDHERTYYWRVRGTNDIGSGGWSEVRSFVTQKAVPVPPVLVSPDNGSTNVLTTLQVSWEASASATSYRIQVSKQSNFSSTVVNVGNITSTSYEVTNLEHSTTYYWRVNASNESGSGNWSSVWSFETIIADPDAPILLSPVIGTDSVSTFPVLRWDESDRAETYRVQVALNTQFTGIVLDRSELDSTRYTFVDELNEFTTYYWRVNATNIGGTSAWSDVSYFTTDQAVPVAPVLVGPEDGTSDVTNAMMLWNSVETATRYRLQISMNADFSTTTVDSNDIENAYFDLTNLEKGMTYYWRVRGVSRVGQGYWSEIWSFETGDIVSVEMIDHQIPDAFVLGQNFPNPFNPATTIQFALPADVNVRLEIYNMLGQRIAILIDGEYHTAGTYQALWDARDDFGREISSGIYIYRITAGDFVETKKMTLMK